MKSWRSLITWLRPTPRSPAERIPTITTRATPPDAGGRPLRLRLLFWIILSLLPAATLAVVQGFGRVSDDLADVRDLLIQTAKATASDTETLLASEEQILRSLSNLPEVREGNAQCSDALTSAMKGLTYFTNIGRANAEGEILCAAVRPEGSTDVSTRPWWPNADQRMGFFVTPQIYSNIAKRNVLAGVLPLQNSARKFDGVMVVTLDVRWLDTLLASDIQHEGAVAGIFDSAGTLIASNDYETARQIFGTPGVRTASVKSELLSATGSDGTDYSYTVVALPGEFAYAAYALRDRDLFTGTYLHVATDLLLPVLMLGAASLAIWIATDRLVTRWIVYLRRIATAYGRGHYAIRPAALAEAPSEFRLLGETFSNMAAAVQDRDRELREALEQKSLLIKETHHRVKNNLQIVMSLLSLQAGHLKDPASQGVLRQAQARVNALALVHRILHEIEDLDAVDVKNLLQDLARQIQEGFGADRRDLKLDLEIASRRLPSELAVPLTLFTVEALTNAFKHAYPPGTRGGVIRVTLLPVEDGKLRLAIEDDGLGTEHQEGSPQGIGSRLIQAFAQQVGGTTSIKSRAGGGTVVSLTFADPLFERVA
jgi:two-component sensor histidine kinase